MNDFRDRAATGGIGDAAAVAKARNFVDGAGRYEEIGPQLEVEGCRARIEYGAGAECHIGAFGPYEGHKLLEDLVGAVSAVGELEGPYAAVVAGLDDLLREGCV